MSAPRRTAAPQLRAAGLPRFALAGLMAFAVFTLAACQQSPRQAKQAKQEAEQDSVEIAWIAPTPSPPPPPPAAPGPVADAAGKPALEPIEVTGSRVGAAELRARRQAVPSLSESPMSLAPMSPPQMQMPAPEPITENYAEIKRNAITRVAEQPVSTFSIDVDTGSYSNIRSLIQHGQRPPRDAVRIEELVNYFSYDYPGPTAGAQPFAVHTELAPSPFHPNRLLLRVALQAERIDAKHLPPANLVFLIDTSGSMQDPNKLPLLKRGFRLLVEQLRPQDSVAIVTYAGSAGLVLAPTMGSNRSEIMAALDRLEAGGSTNGGAGIELAYRVAKQARREGGINRVLLATDGDFNVGNFDQRALETLVADQRESGIALSTLGFGRGNYNDAMAERLADVGNGNHAYVDSINEAAKVLVQQMGGTLHTVASDVKVQIEFNPAKVAEYRLLGYENRLLAREDFDNDRVDAGEIGAGHSVTALYELALVGSGGEASAPLRYAPLPTDAALARGDELGLLRLRYKRPGQSRSQLIEAPIQRSALRAQPSEQLMLAAAVAGFGELLRGGEYAGELDYDKVALLARRAMGDFSDPQRAEFIELVRSAQALSGGAELAHRDD
jgi:Ca-activated chloride channel family protein